MVKYSQNLKPEVKCILVLKLKKNVSIVLNLGQYAFWVKTYIYLYSFGWGKTVSMTQYLSQEKNVPLVQGLSWKCILGFTDKKYLESLDLGKMYLES